MTAAEIENPSERRYAESLDAKGIPWERARCFKFAKRIYTPDFYLPIQGIYIEIIGTRQRWHQLKGKLAVFHAHYPDVTLQVVNMSSTRLLSRSVSKPRGRRIFSK